MPKSFRFKGLQFSGKDTDTVTSFNYHTDVNTRFMKVLNGAWGFDSTSDDSGYSKTFSIPPFSCYLYAISEVGSGNISNSTLFMIMSGQNVNTTSQAIKLYGSDKFSITFLDGLHFTIKASTKWISHCLFRLNP